MLMGESLLETGLRANEEAMRDKNEKSGFRGVKE